jgi:hypothetical protein
MSDELIAIKRIHVGVQVAVVNDTSVNWCPLPVDAALKLTQARQLDRSISSLRNPARKYGLRGQWLGGPAKSRRVGQGVGGADIYYDSLLVARRETPRRNSPVNHVLPVSRWINGSSIARSFFGRQSSPAYEFASCT